MGSRHRRLGLLCLFFVVLAASGLVVAPPAAADDPAPASPDLLVVLDASGSMWGRLGDEPKIVVARRVLADLVADLADDSLVGLVAYGHRREGDCTDIETVLPIAPLDREAFRQKVDSLNPKGKTPITAALGEAFGQVEAAGSPVTVVLISDGLETCDGDPCATVRAAREKGVPLLLHVVGFDVGEEDVSSLECAAQAGGGLYFDARDAEGLGAALDRAVEVAADAPSARLVLGATADGALADVHVRVTDADGEEAAIARTYANAETNPRSIPLVEGTYTVRVEPVAIEAAEPQAFEITLGEGETVERTVEFGSGDLVVRVRQNGEPSDAIVKILRAGTSEEVEAGRTYQNPEKVFRLAAGTYDLEIGSVKVKGAPSHRLEGVEIPAGGRAEKEIAFDTGTLHVGAVAAGALVDATVAIFTADGERVAQGRTYETAKTNPKPFEVLVGTYRVEVKALSVDGGPTRTLEAMVGAGDETTVTAEFGQ